MKAHYSQRGTELVEICRDGGHSGTTDNRPGFQALFEHAMRPGSGITQIGVYSFSRLFRDHYLLELYRRKLKRAWAHIVAITQEVGQDAEGDLVRGALANFDEYRSRQTAKVTMDTMRRNAEAGFWNGAVSPFGYASQVAEMREAKGKKQLAIAPSETVLVEQIYRMKRLGEAVCPGPSMRDQALETIVIDAMAERLLRPDRLQSLLANLLDDSSSAVRERQAHLKALRTERTRVEGAIQNWYDFIDRGVFSANDADFTTRLANQRKRRADLEQEIMLVERQLSTTDRRVTPAAVERLGEVILTKLRSKDSCVRQGFARRFIEKIVVAPGTITITGSIKPLELAASDENAESAPMVPSLDREWCGREDSNFHGLSPTTTSTLRVYQ
ncbi:MAG: recombinase family protein, partial [Sphingomonas sp.]|nr:recombinase family protein [Sphingomonas sp.]